MLIGCGQKARSCEFGVLCQIVCDVGLKILVVGVASWVSLWGLLVRPTVLRGVPRLRVLPMFVLGRGWLLCLCRVSLAVVGVSVSSGQGKPCLREECFEFWHCQLL